MGESYPLLTYCQGTENLGYLFEKLCLITLDGDELPKGEFSQLDQCFSFSVISQSLNFYKGEFTDTFSADKTRQEKSQKNFNLSAFNEKLNH